MNKLTLNAAVKKYGNLKDRPKEEVIQVLAADEKKYSIEDMEDIFATINQLQVNVGTKEDSAKKATPNDSIDLSFLEDYGQLQAIPTKDEDGEIEYKPTEQFTKYIETVEGLRLDEMKDFYQYNASGQFRFTKRGNAVLTGIKLERPQPIHTTRITVKDALEMNRQIYDRNNPPSNSRYFLLKK